MSFPNVCNHWEILVISPSDIFPSMHLLLKWFPFYPLTIPKSHNFCGLLQQSSIKSSLDDIFLFSFFCKQRCAADLTRPWGAMSRPLQLLAYTVLKPSSPLANGFFVCPLDVTGGRNSAVFRCHANLY